MFANAQNIVRSTKGRNIILSGDWYSSMHMRAPLDVIHMASLFGLNSQQARDALTVNPRRAAMHAMTRTKTYKSILMVESSALPNEPSSWKRPRIDETETEEQHLAPK